MNDRAADRRRRPEDVGRYRHYRSDALDFGNTPGAGGSYHRAVDRIDRLPLPRRVRLGMKRAGVAAGASLIVAVSGGCDSVALLRALHLLRRRRAGPGALHVVHVNHGPRPGVEADAAFVASLASGLGLPCRCVALEPGRDDATESTWRRRRYAALAAVAKAVAADAVATAHHADDQLETLLLRLTRGTSVTGMRGIRRRRGGPGGLTIVRPMLDATRAEAEAFLRDLDQPWREDPTNAQTHRRRNALRLRVTPELRAMFPEAARRATGLADDAEYAAEALMRQVRDACPPEMRGARLVPRAAFAPSPAWVRGRVLRRLLIDAGATRDGLGRDQIARLDRAIRDGRGGERTFQFRGNVTVRVHGAEIEIRSRRGGDDPGLATGPTGHADDPRRA